MQCSILQCHCHSAYIVAICLYSNCNSILAKVMDLNRWFLFNEQCLGVGNAKVGINKKRWKGTTSAEPIMNCQLGEFNISLMEIIWTKFMLC